MKKKTKKQVKTRILDEIKSKVNRLIHSPEYERDVNELRSITDKRWRAKSRAAFEELSKKETDKRAYIKSRYNSFLPIETLKFLLFSGNEEILMNTFYADPRHVVDVVPYKWPTKDNTEFKILDDKGYLHLKVNPKEARYKIHYAIDDALDKYGGTKEKRRFRKEQIQAYQIWEERRLRKSFKQIAKEQGIKEPAARKQFYKAFELSYGKKYNPADYEKPKIKKEYLKRTCNTCIEKPTCKDLCPDVITFVEQDVSKYEKEKPMTKKRYDITHFGEIID